MRSKDTIRSSFKHLPSQLNQGFLGGQGSVWQKF